MTKGKLYIVATPIGNLEDISFRAISTLKNVDIILAEDTRHTSILLKHFDISKPTESYHKFNEKEKSEHVIQKLESGKNIALVSDAGTPGISDPGNVLIQYCIKNNIEVIPIPGACAFVQALICSGFDTINFAFYGFIPVNNKERKEYLKNILEEKTNIIVIYEAPHKLLKTLQDLNDTLGNVELCISKEISKLHENHFRTNILDAISYYEQNTPRGEFVIVIKKNIIEEKKYNLKEKNTQDLVIQEYLQNKEDFSLKEISKNISENLGLSKNEIYNFLINNKNTMC